MCKGKGFYWNIRLKRRFCGSKTLKMILFKDPRVLTRYLDSYRKKKVVIGFVPTMGALHAGHVSLLRQCKDQSDLSVCSIFVNPTQFNDKKDYDKYPVTLEADIEKIEAAGIDILFLPAVDELYPDGTKSLEQYPIGYLETILEGEFRPGHFQGVCQVMHRLLKVVQPNKLFMGQKDFQQSLVVQQLLRITGYPTELIVCATMRERNGLAMSSRNMRLSDTEREHASKIHDTLEFINRELKAGDLSKLKKEANSRLTKNGFKIDYVEIANVNNLAITDHWDGKEPLVTLAAVFVNGVRLIDNVVLKA